MHSRHGDLSSGFRIEKQVRQHMRGASQGNLHRLHALVAWVRSPCTAARTRPTASRPLTRSRRAYYAQHGILSKQRRWHAMGLRSMLELCRLKAWKLVLGLVAFTGPASSLSRMRGGRQPSMGAACMCCPLGWAAPCS